MSQEKKQSIDNKDGSILPKLNALLRYQPELNKRIDLKKKKMKSEIMKTDGNVSTYNESQNKPYFLTKSQMKFNQSISNSKNISTLQEERLASKKSSIAHINEEKDFANKRSVESNLQNMFSLEKESMDKFFQVINEMSRKIDDEFEILKQKCEKMVNITNILEENQESLNKNNDSNKIFNLIKDLVTSILTTSQTEINLGFKTREFDKKNMEYLNLRIKFQKLTERFSSSLEKIEMLEQNNTVLKEENHKLSKTLLYDNKLKGENSKKIEGLEKRIEFLLENDLNLIGTSQDKLRRCFTDLMKENENNKRDIELKTKENTQLKEKITGLNYRLGRMNIKLETMKNEKLKEDFDQKIYKNEESNSNDLLTTTKIPPNLDFRVNSLKIEYSHIINDIMEHGTNSFVQHLLLQDNIAFCKDELVLVTSQLVSFKEFSEKLNILLCEISKINLLDDEKAIMIFLSKHMKKVFSCERTNLWLVDAMTGMLYSFQSDGKEYRCFTDKGYFSEVLKSGKALNKKDIKKRVLYVNSETCESFHVDNILLIPIKHINNKILGLLEISNISSESFGFDQEYFAIVFAHFLTNLMQKIMFFKFYKSQIKCQFLIYEAFLDFLTSQNKLQLSQKVGKWLQRILGISSYGLYFLENQTISVYKSNEGEIQQNFPINRGIAGYVFQNQKSCIITDVKESNYYDKLVDVSSNLPVFAIPLIDKNTNKTIGVLEAILKQKIKLKNEKEIFFEGLSTFLGLDESSENILELICEFLANAIIINNF